MKFRITTSEVISKVFEVDIKNEVLGLPEEKAKAALDEFSDLISVKTISWEIAGVEKIE